MTKPILLLLLFFIAVGSLSAQDNLGYNNPKGNRNWCARQKQTSCVRVFVTISVDAACKVILDTQTIAVFDEPGTKNVIIYEGTYRLIAKSITQQSVFSIPITISRSRNDNLFNIYFTDKVKANKVKMNAELDTRYKRTDWALLKNLIENDSGIYLHEYDGLNVLDCAVVNGQMDLVELIINKVSAAKTKTKIVQNAFAWALRAGQTEICKYLIKNGADIKANYGYNQKAIHLAASCWSYSTTRFLIENGADVNARDSNGNTPFDLMLDYNSHNRMQFLKKDTNIVYDKYGLPTSLPDSLELSRVAELLIDNGVHVNEKNNDGFTALMRIAYIRFLSHTSLPYLAPYLGAYLSLSKLLLEKGADLTIRDNEGSTPLEIAIKHDNDKLFCLFMDKLNNVNIKTKDSISLLAMAAFYNQPEIVRCLVNKGADINEVNKDGHSLFYQVICSKHGSWKIPILIELNAEINDIDAEDTNLLERTIIYPRKEYISIIRQVLNKKASLPRLEKIGYRLFIEAVYRGYTETVNVLLEKGIKLKTDDKSPLLQSVAQKGNIAMASTLLKNGIDVNTIDVYGKTPLDYAKTDEMKNLIRTHKGKLGAEIK